MVKYNHCGGFLFVYYFNLDVNVFAISVFVIFSIVMQSQTCFDSLEHSNLHRQGKRVKWTLLLDLPFLSLILCETQRSEFGFLSSETINTIT